MSPLHCYHNNNNNNQQDNILILGNGALVIEVVVVAISNSNWTEWSTIQGVIKQVIFKLDEREAQGRFEIKRDYSLNCTTQSPIINYYHNYNKIQEDYDSGINYLIYSTSKLDAEKDNPSKCT